MILIKCQNVCPKFVAYYLAKNRVKREELRLIPKGKNSFILTGDFAWAIGKTVRHDQYAKLFQRILIRSMNSTRMCVISTGFKTKSTSLNVQILQTSPTKYPFLGEKGVPMRSITVTSTGLW